MHHTPIFALDIGTRSVIGVIIQPLDDGKFQIIDIKMKEHKDRSMLDGQIHDVVAVAETIQSVKEQLEEKQDPLYHVSVAAAGRSLKTARVKLDLSIEGQPLLRKEDVRAFELSAVQQVQKQLIEEKNDQDITHYHCVGYSVVNYYLDHQIIGNLIDQRGQTATVEIIATFLPRVVVDSLISSLSRANLQMEALTLEPIAAIHVLIPPSMRKLNIALVDIGAGTSDIAITAEGTVIAYGMVPYAGDEITEAISQQFLLDFHIAEEIKRQLSTTEEVAITDILGFTEIKKSEEIIDQINKPIEELAQNITNKILELNGKSPQAVMLVGGGSQTPRLTKKSQIY
ncbi:cell division protein FtsA [Tepidibacillus marianensis]|uniref:cell division protein FtsA n=1 Tax=Tepidibacillus marianensis TaxID=3131995 RepID=UPI0030CF4EA7